MELDYISIAQFMEPEQGGIHIMLSEGSRSARQREYVLMVLGSLD